MLLRNKTMVKYEYKLARVTEVFPAEDGKVCHVTAEYKVLQPNTDIKKAQCIKTDRSVHNLVVIVLVNWTDDEKDQAV